MIYRNNLEKGSGFYFRSIVRVYIRYYFIKLSKIINLVFRAYLVTQFLHYLELHFNGIFCKYISVENHNHSFERASTLAIVKRGGNPIP